MYSPSPEIRAFWKACDTLTPAMAAYFRLRLVTLQRGKEVAALRATHLDGRWWTIPAAVAKNKLDHRVWLSERAQTILQSVPASDGYLLAAAGGDVSRPRRPRISASQISEGTISGARRPVGWPVVACHNSRSARS